MLILIDVWSIQKYVTVSGYKTAHAFMALYATFQL